MKVLVLRFGALGDVLLTLPALARLRAALPGAEIRYLTREPFARLLERSPLIDRVERLEPNEGLWSLTKRLQSERPDVVLDLHSSLRSRALTALLTAPVWRAPGTHLARRRMVGRGSKAGLEPVWQRHVRLVVRALEAWGAGGDTADTGGVTRTTAQGATDRNDGPGAVTGSPEIGSVPETPALLLPAAEARRKVAVRLEAGVRAVALLPGARWQTKRWPERHFTALAGRLAAEGVVPVVLGSPEEAALLARVAAGVQTATAPTAAGTGVHAAEIYGAGPQAPCRTGPRAVVCTGDWDELMAWLERCERAVGNDSGLIHLAEAVGTPVVTLFGPTVPAFGFAPRLAGSSHLEHPLPCRPCSLHGGDRCPLEHHACLEQLQPEEVVRPLMV